MAKGRRPGADRRIRPDDSGTRRTEILQTAASLIASSGLRTSLQEIADAAGILPGSLYHHFESKEAILIELIRRYQDDLNRIGQTAQARLDEPDSRPVSEKIIELGSAIAELRRAAPGRAADVLLRGAERGSRADPADPTATHRDSGGDAADAARRQVEWLHQTRHRPSHAGRPDLPDHDAGRARRDAQQCSCRPGGRAAVPDHVAGIGSCGRPTDAALDRSNALAAAATWSRRGPTTARPIAERQGRARPRGGANGVRPQGLRGHHHPGHRGGGGPGHRHRLSGDRIQGRTPRLDHASRSAGRSRRGGSACCARMPRPSRSWTR